jgi:ATP-binding cassette subfamily F protein 3
MRRAGKALVEFEGTVRVISHDRYFLDRVVERIVEIEEAMLHEYPGDTITMREKGLRGVDHMSTLKKVV